MPYVSAKITHLKINQYIGPTGRPIDTNVQLTNRKNANAYRPKYCFSACTL